MGFQFTPVLAILTLGALALFGLIAYLVKKRHYKSAITVTGVALFISVTMPVKLTTNTETINKQRDTAVALQHEKQLNELPPRVTNDRENYSDFLARKNKELTERGSK